ncbi:MAG: hypothetical protein FJ276_21835 [Planctomycetes bacterium]|nr:hypothetical protein [Planctomycetota bacterium]
MADEVIREVRRVRHEISRRCGHDPQQVVAWYRAYQDELKRSGKYRFYQPDESNDAAATSSGTGERVST